MLWPVVDVLTVRFPVLGGGAVTLNVVLVAAVSGGAVARSVYPVPGLSILRFWNVAMPFTAFTGAPPESVPPLDAGSSASPIAPVNPCTTCSAASSAATCTGGVIAAPALVVCSCCVNPRWVAGGGGPGVMSNAVLGPTGVAVPKAALRGY